MNVKDLIIGAMMSLSKVEKEQILKSIVAEDDAAIEQATPVEKKELKIISNERFNELLKNADNFLNEKYGEKFEKRREELGIKNFLYSFKNTKFESAVYEQRNGIQNETYLFKTSNNLNKFSNSAYVTSTNREFIKLHFTVSYDGRGLDFSDLNYFYLTQYGTIYTFIDLTFDKIIYHESGETTHIFYATLIKKEVEVIKESTMGKKDIIDQTVFRM